MTDEQWRAAWVLSQMADDLEGDAQRSFLQSAAADPQVEGEVIALFEELHSETSQLPHPGRRMGDVVGRYVLKEHIGRGGMGDVYSAEDKELRRSVALKFLPGGVVGDDQVATRIILEARLASRLNHPNIVTVHEVIVFEGLPVIVMELVGGKPLRTMCAQATPVPAALAMAGQIMQALALAHANGVVHRDLKPENIMVRSDGYIKVLDFGLARRTFLETTDGVSGADVSSTTGLPVGTLRYMSPEQCRGQSAIPASDVFAAGLVLYEILTGTHPFEADSPLDTAHAIMWLKPTPPRLLNPEVADSVNDLVVRMLAKEASARPSARNVAEALTSIAPSRAANRHLTYRAFAVLAAVVSVAFLAWWWAAFFNRVHPVDNAGPEPKLTLLTGVRGLEQKPAFSPDGHRVAFEFSSKDSPVNHLYVQDIAAGTLTRLTNDKLPDFQPAFSPDGSKLAFLRRGSNGTLRVMVMPVNSAIPWQVGEIARGVPLIFRLLTWDGQGTHIIVVDKAPYPNRQNSLFAISLATGGRRQITFPKPNEEDRMPQTSPDKRLLGFVRVNNPTATGRLLAIPLDNAVAVIDWRKTRPLASLGESIWTWGWTQDGQDLLVSFAAAGRIRLFRLPMGNGSPVRVKQVDDQVRDLAVSNQGNRLVYASGVARASSIWKYSATTSNHPSAPLITSATFESDPRFSPNGQQIAFASLRSGDSTDVWVCRRDGSDAKKVSLFDKEHQSGSPNWSPDGRYIAYDTNFPKTPSSIYVSDVLGGKPRRLTGPGSTDITPSWSQDGRFIYYSSDRGGSRNIWKVPVAGGVPKQVTHNGGFECFEASLGNALYFTREEQNGGIWRLSLASGQETLVPPLKVVSNRYWEGCARGIYFVQAAEGPTPSKLGIYFALPEKPPVLKFFSFSTLRTVVLRKMPAPAQPVYRGLSVSPDGGTVLYMQGEWDRSNLMLLSNFR